MGEPKVITLSQVAQHKSKKDCWVVINGRVLDVTKFLEEHPGGEEALVEVAGKDATKEFNDIGHSKAAQGLLVKYQVGVLPGFKDVATSDEVYKESSNKGKDMKAFVIKDKGTPKYTTFFEFFVPLLVAGSYFCYSVLARSAQSVS